MVPGNELAQLLKQAKEELGVNPRLLNARMQAITNGYNIAMHMNGQFVASGGTVNTNGLISDARVISSAIYDDYKNALDEAQEKPVETN